MFMQDATRFAADATILTARTLAAPVQTGLVAGTLVETATGWRIVETLRRGDLLQTFDGGLREVVAIDHNWLMPGCDTTLIRLPGGALNNCADLALLPGQHLMIDTWDAAITAVTALIPAEALAGLHGSTRHTITAPVEVITPLFAEEEVIYANGGLLLHCPGIADGPGATPADGFFTVLGRHAALTLLRQNAFTPDSGPVVRHEPRTPGSIFALLRQNRAA